MLRRFDNLPLFTFLLLGIFFLLSLNYAGFVSLKENSNIEFKTAIEFEKNAKLILESNSKPSGLESQNSNLQISYSLNGGDTYSVSNNLLDFTNLRNPDIKSIPNSFQYRPPYWDLPACKSVTLFLSDSEKEIKSKIQHVVIFEEDQSKLPKVNIGIKNSEFIGNKDGIYTTGLRAGKLQKYGAPWWERSGNFSNRGMDSERRAQMTISFNDGKTHSQTCGIRIGGNASRGFSQKSLKLYARSQYGSESLSGVKFNDDDRNEFESLVIRSSGNDFNRTLFADLFMQKVAAGSNLYTQKGRPVQLFINGNYWGIYNLRERISIYNIANYHDKKPSKVTILENGQYELKDGKAKQHFKFHQLIDRLENEQMTDALMSEVVDKIDLNSLIDYVFFETYFANNDWPNNNTMVYKIKGEKWRWILNDLDYSLAYPGESNVNKDMFKKLENSGSDLSILFYGLLKDDGFKAEFKQKCKSNISEFLGQKAVSIFENCKEEIENEIENHILRWRTIDSKNEWKFHCQQNLDFINNRSAIYLDQLETLN